jgi:hypothetical protein
MRQGGREPILDFKTRYDNQVKANESVGAVNDEESLVAIDFLSKLDPKWFTGMLTVLRNNTVINLASYPTTTLTGTYRSASTWTSDGLIPATRESHSAFVIDKVKGKPIASKWEPPKGGPEEKSSSLLKANIECYICGKVGHYCNDYPDRKHRDIALLPHEDSGYSDADSDDENTMEVAFLTLEKVLFAGYVLLLDSQ